MSILISIAGASASGKTTIVDKLINLFNKDDIAVISMDNYYNDNSLIPLEERKKINYDHPSSLDLPLLKKHLKSLLEGKSINCPLYDFKMHNRSINTITINPAKVIILEGIFALYDEDILNLSDIKIFVESEDDIAFIRRLKRDIALRGRTVDEVIDQYLLTVKPMFNLYVKKTIKNADIIIPNDYKNDIAVSILESKIKDIINS